MEDDQGDLQQIEDVLSVVRRSWAAGKNPPDEAILAAHPHLPGLADALRKARGIHWARQQAEAAQDRAHSLNDTSVDPRPRAAPPDAAPPDAAPPEPARLDAPNPAAQRPNQLQPLSPEAEHFGDYRIELIGRGGMGEVYKAYHPNGVFALKKIRASAFVGQEELDRFRQEADLLNRLQHPHIVKIHEVGEHQGQPFFLMEFCQGGTLRSKMNRGMTSQWAAQLTCVLAQTIAAAHDKGIIHRDLKPANILFDQHDQVKLTDFGLAKDLNESHPQTLSGQILGTPAYMAPEQARGENNRVGPQTDIWALGVILYEMLTGTRPFQGSTKEEICEAVIAQAPKSLRAINTKLPAHLETICLKCLQKPPERRYASARHLAEDLERVLSGKRPLARPVSTTEKLARWVMLQPVVASLVALVVLLLVVGLGVTSKLAYDLSESNAKLIASRDQVKRQAQVNKTIYEKNIAAQNDLSIAERKATIQAFRAPLRRGAGWTWKALETLAAVTNRRESSEDDFDLRNAAVDFLSQADLNLVKSWPVTAPYSLAFRPDSRQLAIGCYKARFTCEIWLVDLDDVDGQQLRRLSYPASLPWQAEHQLKQDGVYSLAYTPDGRWLLAGLRSGRLLGWRVPRGEAPRWSVRPELDWTIAPEAILALQFHPQRGDLYALARNGQLFRWDQEALAEKKPPPLATFAPKEKGMTSLSVGPGEHVLCSYWGTAWLLNGQSLEVTRSFSLVSPTWHPSGSCFLGSEEQAADLYDSESWELTRTFSDPGRRLPLTGRYRKVQFSHDGGWLATRDRRGELAIWSMASGSIETRLPVGANDFRIAFSPDGKYLAVTRFHEVRLYRIRGAGSESVFTTAIQRPWPVLSFCVSGDKEHAITLSGSPRQQRLEVAAFDLQRPLQPIWQHRQSRPQRISRPTIARQPQGKVLVRNWSNRALELYDGKTHLATLEQARGTQLMRFSPNGQRLWILAKPKEGATAPLLGYDLGSSPARPRSIPIEPSQKLLKVLAGSQALESLDVRGPWVLVGGGNGRLMLFRQGGNSAALETISKPFSSPVTAVGLEVSGAHAVVGQADGQIHRLQIPDCSNRETLALHAEGVEAIRFASAVGWMATASRDQTIRLWRKKESGWRPFVELPHPGPVQAMEFSQDGGSLFVLLKGESGVREWDLGLLLSLLAQMDLVE